MASYSMSRRAGALLFTSGFTALDGDTVPTDDFATQVDLSFAAAADELAANGATFADLISVSVYITDNTNFAVMNERYLSYFSDPLPTRTTVEVGLYEGVLFEMKFTALIPE